MLCVGYLGNSRCMCSLSARARYPRECMYIPASRYVVKIPSSRRAVEVKPGACAPPERTRASAGVVYLIGRCGDNPPTGNFALATTAGSPRRNGARAGRFGWTRRGAGGACALSLPRPPQAHWHTLTFCRCCRSGLLELSYGWAQG